MEPIQLGKYKLIEDLGGGGFGRVYKAIDSFGRTVAIKVLKPGWSDDLEVLERFRREALAAGSLFHPHIATILDMDEVEGRRFIVMRYVEGRSLDQILKEKGSLPWNQAQEIVRQIADALSFAHSKGFIHRDVKPANILISEEEGAVLTDFGLVRAATSSGFSSSNSVVGTPNYIAPEIWRGKPPASPASDEYSLACVVYEMLLGDALFAGESTPEIITKHVVDGPQFPEEWSDGVPGDFSQVLKKALEMSPEDRFPDSGEFVSALEELNNQAEEKQKRKVETERENKEEQAWQAVAEMQRLLEQAKQAEADRQLKEEQAQQGETERKRKEEEARGKKLKALKEKLKKVGVVVVGLVFVGLLVWGTASLFKLPATAKKGNTSTRTIDNMEMVYVPEGEFLMGAEDSGDESPQHTLYLNGYWIDKYEVSNEQFVKFVLSTGYETYAEKAGQSRMDWAYVNGADWQSPEGSGSSISDSMQHQVVHVSWNDAQAYCEWAGGRLPTEAEWEKAARGTDGKTYPWGEETPNNNLLNYNHHVGGTTRVGNYLDGVSFYGNFDMAGNVLEWTGTLYQDYPYDPEDGREDAIARGDRVLRGGAWDFDEKSVHSANRLKSSQDYTNMNVGFRCASSEVIH